MLSEEDIPTFLNRKLTPRPQATAEERREYAAKCPAPPDVAVRTLLSIDHEAIAEEKRLKTAARIAKMKARQDQKRQAIDIPDKYLCWDSRRLKFYDTRKRP